MNVAYEKFDLTGKTAYVTGGGAGLGYYMARGLARSGAKVMIAARRENVLKQAAEKIAAESNGNQVLYQTIDLEDQKSVDESAKAAIETLGGIDIFVGNAAIEATERIENNKNETNEKLFQVNVISNMALVSAFAPHMRNNQWGRVIFSSSMISKVSTAYEGFGAYSASKGALNGYIRDAAAELGHDGITVNGIIIGMFLTDMVKEALSVTDAEVTKRELTAMHALGRLGEPEEIEGLTQLLASEAGAYITGAEIPLDGGTTIMMRPHWPES